LAAATFGADVTQQAFANQVLRKVKQNLETYGIQVDQNVPPPLHQKRCTGGAVAEALRSKDLRQADAVLLLGARMTDEAYNMAKYESLSSVNDAGQHVANQWFDLQKRSVWSASAKSFDWAVQICTAALMAKLGHTPWALDVQSWFSPSPPKDLKLAVIGYDVCHLRDPKKPKSHRSIVASIRVDGQEGAQPATLSRIAFGTRQVPAETVPCNSLKEMIPEDFARGRLLIVHRDGEFPLAELACLEKYHAELKASEGGEDTAFVLVECVKWAGASPRLYSGTKSPEAGTLMAIHPEDILLASSKDLSQGTANPLNVRLARVLGTPPKSFQIDEFAWAKTVFDLSYLHHGSAMRRPRLPITTHFADRLVGPHREH